MRTRALFIRHGWNAELWIPVGFGALTLLAALVARAREDEENA